MPIITCDLIVVIGTFISSACFFRRHVVLTELVDWFITVLMMKVSFPSSHVYSAYCTYLFVYEQFHSWLSVKNHDFLPLGWQKHRYQFWNKFTHFIILHPSLSWIRWQCNPRLSIPCRTTTELTWNSYKCKVTIRCGKWLASKMYQWATICDGRC